MIETLVTILHILTCLALILAILLQSGKVVASARLWWRCRSSPRSARRYDGTGSIHRYRIGDIYDHQGFSLSTQHPNIGMRHSEISQRLKKPTPRKRRPRAKRQRPPVTQKTAARRPVIQQKIRPQVTSRPQKLMHQKLMHQKLTHQKRTHQKLTHQKRTHPRPTLNQPIHRLVETTGLSYTSPMWTIA